MTEKFSVRDFLTYIVPGLIGLLGIYLVTSRLGPEPTKLLPDSSDKAWVWVGSVIIALAYAVGLVSAAAIQAIEPRLYKAICRRVSGPLDDIAGNKTVETKFREVVASATGMRVRPESSQEPASKDELPALDRAADYEANILRYYVARSLLRDLLPRTIGRVERHSALRQSRRNLVIPVALLWAGGLAYLASAEHWPWAVIATLVAPYAEWTLLRGMTISRQREFVEVILGAIVLSDVIAMKKSANDDEPGIASMR